MLVKKLFILVILFPSIAAAQSQGNVWVMGNHNILDFNGPLPVATGDGSIDLIDQQVEGVASICDSQGQLLFYSDGRRLWDWDHDLIVDSLLGHQSSTHGAFIIPVPDSSTTYLLVTLDAAQNNLENGMRYSVINACRLSGVSVSSTNQLIASNMTEKVSVCQNPNGNYWLIGHEYNSDRYFTCEVSSLGVGDTSYISAGPVHQHANPNSSNAAIGQMKASPNGQFIASAITNSVKLVDIATFNPSNGAIASVVTFAPDSTELGFPNGSYGISFSPNSNYLYVTSLSEYKVWQYDMTELPSNPNGFLQSRELIYSSFNNEPGVPESFQQMQIATNGKIYLVNYGNPYMAVINSPDMPGIACSFEDSTLVLTHSAEYGLPSFIDSYQYTASGICDTTNNISEVEQVHLTLFPNPSNSLTTVSIPSAEMYSMVVMDATGRSVVRLDKQTNTTTVNVAELASGIYSLVATTRDGERYTGRLVVER